MDQPVPAIETLEGTLEQILFVNEASGYIVALVDVNGDGGSRRRITAVGTFAGVEIGAGLRIAGRFEKHPRYGDQFRVEDYETIRPASVHRKRNIAAGMPLRFPSTAKKLAGSVCCR